MNRRKINKILKSLDKVTFSNGSQYDAVGPINILEYVDKCTLETTSNWSEGLIIYTPKSYIGAEIEQRMLQRNSQEIYRLFYDLIKKERAGEK